MINEYHNRIQRIIEEELTIFQSTNGFYGVARLNLRQYYCYLRQYYCHIATYDQESQRWNFNGYVKV